MSQRVEDRIVIAGGGIAGLALARALHARGVPYLVIERSAQAGDGGLAVNLPGNAVQALGQLGLGAQIAAQGHAFHRREYRSGRDRLLFGVDEDEFWGREAGPRSIRRSVLTAMLAEGLALNAIVRGQAVRSFVHRPDHVEVQLADGSSVRGRLLVGADGVGSAVRKVMFPGAQSGHALLADSSWRFIAPNPGVNCWTVWAGKQGMVLLMPISADEVYGWAAITAKVPRGAGVEALRHAIRDLPEHVRRSVDLGAAARGGLFHSPLEEVRLESWSNQRAVLIGDAAHATAPVWAEGVALGLEDAIVLARHLETGGDVAAALARYEAERRPRVAHVQEMTDVMSAAAKLPPMVRNLLLPIVGPKRYRQTYGPLRAPVQAH